MTQLGDRRTWGVAAGALSVLWIIGAAWYALDYVGLAGLAALAPHELGAVLAGIFAPLLCLWLIVGHAWRSQALKAHTDALAARLAELTFPDQAGEHRIHSVAESLRRQAIDLRMATEEAAA